LVLALGAGTSVLFTQQSCAFFEFTPTSAIFAPSGGNGSVTCDQGVVTNGVYTGCGWAAISNVSWITINSGAISDKTGFGTVQYTVQPNTSAVTRTGTLTFSNGNYLSATYTIAQSGVTSAPSTLPIAATPAALIFYYQRGQPVPGPQTLNILTNPGNVQFTVSATTNKGGNWLAATPASGTTSANGSAAVSISVNPANLTPGVYSGDVSAVLAIPISINFRDASLAASTPVTLTVSDAPPPAVIAPTVLQFQYDPNRPAALPPPQAVSINSVNGAATPFTVTSCVLTPAVGANWVSFDSTAPPTSGNFAGPPPAASGSTISGVTPAIVNISVNPVALAPGRYVALLRFNSTSCPSPPVTIPKFNGEAAGKSNARDAGASPSIQSTAIIVSVGNGKLIPSQQDITFDDTTPSLQAATVLSTNGFVISPTVLSLNAPDGWLTLDPLALSATPAFFNVAATPTDITLQQYNGVLVFADAAGVTGTAITVEATAGPSANAWHCAQTLPNGRISPVCVVAFSAPFNVSPNPQTLMISNLSATSAAIVVTSDLGWLSVQSPIAVPGSLIVTANAGPAQGTYSGSIIVTGSGVNAPPLTIPVSFTVTP
jgi:hypothetical protein